MDFLLQPEQGGGNGNLIVPLERGPRPQLPDNPAARAAIPPLFIDGLEPIPVGDLVAAQMGPPVRDVPRPAPAPVPRLDVGATHDRFVGIGNHLVHQTRKSNTVRHLFTQGLPEAALRTASLFQWDGTGITQHQRWQAEPVRSNVINAPIVDGVRQVGPEQWAALHNDVWTRRDQLGRRYANCAELAGTMAHSIFQQINDPNNPSMAGVEVRQAYGSQGNGHSWVEVRYPNGGPTMVYDPWQQRTGRIEDMDPSYRQNVTYSPWYGRRPG